MDNKRADMPKKIDILEFWAERILKEYPDKYHMDIYFEPQTDDDKSYKEYNHWRTSVCFACGSHIGTERCHILPVNQGGNNKLDNLHLLCKECHLESEYLHGTVYWEWFKTKFWGNSGSRQRLINTIKIIEEMVRTKGLESIKNDFPNVYEVLSKNKYLLT